MFIHISRSVRFKTLLIAIAFIMNVSITTAQTWSSMNGPWRADRVRQLAAAYDGTTLVLYAADSGSTLIKYDEAEETWTHITAITNPWVVACKSDTPSIVLANVGTVLKRSSNSGGNWSNVTGLPSQFVPRTLVSAPKEADPMRVWLGTEKMTDNSSLWKSTDGGRNFSPIDTFRTAYHTNITAIFFDPVDINYVYIGGSGIVNGEFVPVDETQPLDAAADSNGFWKSVNGGVTWTQENSKLKGKNITAIAQARKENNDDVLLAGVSKKNGSAVVYHSTDAGAHWSGDVAPLFPANIIYAIQVDPVDKYIVYVSTDNGIFYSTDAGYHFSEAVKNLFDRNVLSFTAAIHNSTVKYFAGTSSAIFTGDTSKWTDISRGIDIGSSISFFIVNGDIASVSNTFSGSSVFNGEWLNYCIEDTGRFFGRQLVLDETMTGYVLGITYPRSGSIPTTSIWMGTPEHWDTLLWSAARSANETDSIYCITQNADGEIFAGGDYVIGNNIIFNFMYRDDEGDWQYDNISSSSSVVSSLAADMDDADVMYAALLDEGVWKGVRDEDGAWDWNNVLEIEGDAIRNISIQYAGSQKTIYALCSSNNLWKSTNGNTWEIKNTPSSFKKIISHPSYTQKQKYLWAIGDNGNKIYKTKDSCVTWEEVNTATLPKPINDIQTDNGNDENFFVATSQGIHKINPKPEPPQNVREYTGGSYQSVHPCITWDESQELDLPSFKYKIYKKSGAGAWYFTGVTTSDAFYEDDEEYIYDSGDPMTVRYRVKVIDNTGNESDVSNNVSIVVNSVGVQKIRTGNLLELPKEFSVEQNFPNPFNPTTTIKFALPVDATVSLKIFDVNGKEI
ncbi:MAG: hypothetical protein AAB071_04215, partial [Bacteroidota bacterium]